MMAVRHHVVLLPSKGSAELNVQDAHSMPGSSCQLSAASTAGLLLGVLTHGLSS